MSRPKRFVCIIASTIKAATYYVGAVSETPARLAAHNEGLCPIPHPSSVAILVCIDFDEEQPALKCERI